MASEESPEKASNSSPELEEVDPESSSTTPPTTTWQAIFAPQYNTYYFYNPVTQETTWINPLQQQQPQPEASTSTSTSTIATSSSATETSVVETETETPVQNESEEDADAQGTATTASAASARYAALQEAALAQGIDPLLAHLDPSLLAPSVPGSSGGSSGMFFFFHL